MQSTTPTTMPATKLSISKNKEAFKILVQTLDEFNIQDSLIEGTQIEEAYKKFPGIAVDTINWLCGGNIIDNEKQTISWPKITLTGTAYALFNKFSDYLTSIYLKEFQFNHQKLGGLYNCTTEPNDIKEFLYVLLLRFSASILSGTNISDPANLSYLSASGQMLITKSMALLNALDKTIDALCQHQVGGRHLIDDDRLLRILMNREKWFSTFMAYIDRISRLSEYTTIIKNTEILLINLENCLRGHLLATLSDNNKDEVKPSGYSKNVLGSNLLVSLKKYLKINMIDYSFLNDSTDIRKKKKLYFLLKALGKDTVMANHAKQLLINKIMQEVLSEFTELTQIGGWQIFFSGLVTSNSISGMIEYHLSECNKITSSIGNGKSMSNLMRSDFLSDRRGVKNIGTLSCLSWGRLDEIEGIRNDMEKRYKKHCISLLKKQELLIEMIPEKLFTFVDAGVAESQSKSENNFTPIPKISNAECKQSSAEQYNTSQPFIGTATNFNEFEITRNIFKEMWGNYTNRTFYGGSGQRTITLIEAVKSAESDEEIEIIVLKYLYQKDNRELGFNIFLWENLPLKSDNILHAKNPLEKYQKQSSFAQNYHTRKSPIHNRSASEDIAIKKLAKQNQLVNALLKGNLAVVKKLESEGASFLDSDTNALFPLAAAVYGANWKLVKYVEAQIQDNAIEQWKKIDIKTACDCIDKCMPTFLSANPTYKELGAWYINHKNALWCSIYDKKILGKMDCTKWGVGDGGWTSSGRADGLLSINGNILGEGLRQCTENMLDERGVIHSGTMMLTAPSIAAHNSVVENICSNLNMLKKMVETNAQPQNAPNKC